MTANETPNQILTRLIVCIKVENIRHHLGQALPTYMLRLELFARLNQNVCHLFRILFEMRNNGHKFTHAVRVRQQCLAREVAQCSKSIHQLQQNSFVHVRTIPLKIHLKKIHELFLESIKENTAKTLSM